MDARVPTALELAANVFNAASIVLAARNSLHTWWTGIVGCALFAVVFVGARLYADFTLQIFFIGACIVGWWTWARGSGGVERPVTHATRQSFAAFSIACNCRLSPENDRATKVAPSSIAIEQVSIGGKSLMTPFLSLDPTSAVGENCPFVSP